MQGPVAALAWPVGATGHLDEAVVETERVSDRVLPALLILTIVWEGLHDELVNVVQSHHSGSGLLNSHGDESDVGIVRLCVREIASILEKHGRGRRLG